MNTLGISNKTSDFNVEQRIHYDFSIIIGRDHS